MNKLMGVLDDLFDLVQRGLEALRRLARTRRGLALILLGLAAPPVCCLVLGIAGYSLLNFMPPVPAATQAPPPLPTPGPPDVTRHGVVPVPRREGPDSGKNPLSQAWERG